jgi:hypothetical protein
MTARVLAAICAVSFVSVGCGSVGPDWGFDENVDWDVGNGSSHDDTEGDGGTQSFAPCEDTSALSCDPFTNAGCDADAGLACSFYAETEGGSGTFACLTDSTALEGEHCDADEGPWCGPALACFSGTGEPSLCTRLCCGDEDCATSGAACAPFDYPNVEGPFGACEAAAPDGGLDR